jgi:hypothetical protein
MANKRNSEILGAFLTILGLLFLLVNNHLVWFGWDALWPTIPFLIGVFLLRDYYARRRPGQLLFGSLLALFGIFFLLFSAGILSWESMRALWPTIPLIIGISLLILSAASSEAPPVIFGVLLVVFAIVAYLAVGEAIDRRITEPFVRVWPLALVGAGVLIYLRGRRERLAEEVGGSAPRSTDAGDAG